MTGPGQLIRGWRETGGTQNVHSERRKRCKASHDSGVGPQRSAVLFARVILTPAHSFKHIAMTAEHDLVPAAEAVLKSNGFQQVIEPARTRLDDLNRAARTIQQQRDERNGNQQRRNFHDVSAEVIHDTSFI